MKGTETMTLDEIEHKIENARFARDLFGAGDWAKAYKALQIALHPDKYPDPDQKVRAEALFRKLGEWKTLAETPVEIKNGRKKWVVGREIAVGDVSYVRFVQNSKGETFIGKFSQSPGANKLLVKEREVLETLRGGIKQPGNLRYLPEPVDTFELPDKRRVLLLKNYGPFHTAEEIKRAYPAGIHDRHLVWMFKRTMSALNQAHKAGWVHGAPLPCHLLFDTDNHGVVLLDWTLAVPTGKPILAAPTRYKDWYPPECAAKKPATAATDIYLAAKTLCWLAGGDPGTKKFPSTVPGPLQAFLKGCMLQSQTMRPGDVGELLEQMSNVGHLVYGAPKFHVLEMRSV